MFSKSRKAIKARELHTRSHSLCKATITQLDDRLITKTRLYNIDTPPPLKPHFYVVKLGFTGVHILFFLFLLKNIDCGYSLEPPRRGGSNGYPQSLF